MTRFHAKLMKNVHHCTALGHDLEGCIGWHRDRYLATKFPHSQGYSVFALSVPNGFPLIQADWWRLRIVLE